jgi:membrane associated rhomboid family serine protease
VNRLDRFLRGQFLIGGFAIPRSVALLMGATLGLSVAGALGRQARLPIVDLGVLVPLLVWAGQLWRVVTWSFFELDPLNLVFGLYALFLFGRDLSQGWGPVRFLSVSLGIVTSTGVVVSLLGWLWGDLMTTPQFGIWPLVDALTVAWALLFPYRTIQLFFVIPLQGRALARGVFVLIALFAVMGGFARFVPHAVASLLMLAYVSEPSPYRLWLRIKLALLHRQARREPPPGWRVVERKDDDPPRWVN